MKGGRSTAVIQHWHAELLKANEKKREVLRLGSIYKNERWSKGEDWQAEMEQKITNLLREIKATPLKIQARIMRESTEGHSVMGRRN